jgi:hypothetical protein
VLEPTCALELFGQAFRTTLQIHPAIPASPAHWLSTLCRYPSPLPSSFSAKLFSVSHCLAIQSNNPLFFSLLNIYAVQIPVTIAFVWAEGSRLIKHTEIGEQEGGVVWTKVEVVMYPAYAFVAGTLVGMLGIGGGMLINPLLLELGVIPQVRPETGNRHENSVIAQVEPCNRLETYENMRHVAGVFVDSRRQVDLSRAKQRRLTRCPRCQVLSRQASSRSVQFLRSACSEGGADRFVYINLRFLDSHVLMVRDVSQPCVFRAFFQMFLSGTGLSSCTFKECIRAKLVSPMSTAWPWTPYLPNLKS